MKIKILVIFIFWALANHAQVLEKQVSISFKNNTIAEALEKLSKKVGFDYSYNANLFTDKTRISTAYQNQKLRNVLKDLLAETQVDFKETNNQIIFYKKKILATKKAENMLFGTVTDSMGAGISGVKITDADGIIHTSTNKAGNFSIVVYNPKYTLSLLFEHRKYQSKSLKIQLSSNQNLQLKLVEKPAEELAEIGTIKNQIDIVAEADSLKAPLHVPAIFEPNFVTTNNASALRTVYFAGGLFPPASSKGLDAGNILNHISIHLITDYGAGVDGFTFSGVASVYRFSANGSSIAGLGNYVGGNMTGLQIGGLLNTNSLRTDGLQIAGLINIAGLRQAGLQIAGFGNINRTNAYGIQLAGIGNYTRKTNTGVQISGIYNHAKVVQGLQISCIYNHARNLKGLQIGLINVADSAKYGGQIGLINIVKYGYRQLEFGYDEMQFVDMAYRSGAKHFYSILKIGTSFVYEKNYFRVGFGLGSEFKIVGPLAINAEAEAYHVGELDFDYHISTLARLKPGLSLNFDGIALFGSYNFNLYRTDYLNEAGTASNIPLIPNPKSEVWNENVIVQKSRGFSVGIRFIL